MPTLTRSIKVFNSNMPVRDFVVVQQVIGTESETERVLVATNLELIARFEKKIRATLARVWGEDAPAAAIAQTANPSIDEPSEPKMPQTPHGMASLIE